MSWRALKSRYTAGIRAVEEGADPALTLSYVIWPTANVSRASHGLMPRGYRERTTDEIRAIQNERNRRYAEPGQKRWAA